MTSSAQASAPAPAPVAVVTGASTGIGEACALRLDSIGWRVFAGVRKAADGDALRAKASERLTPLFIDVVDAASIATAYSTVADAVGDRGIAGLVNNAGIVVAGPLEVVPIDDIRRQLDVNVIGQIAVTQAFLPLLRRARGRIVNMGSIGGRMATAFTGPYSASKFAMEAITDSLRQELRPWGIGVAIVEPGSIATPIWDKSLAVANEMEAQLPQRARDLYGASVAAMKAKAAELGSRGIAPDAVAKAVVHALTAKRPKTRYIVGRDARLQAIAATFVPDRMMDRVIAGQLKLPKTAPAAEPEREPATP